MALRRNAPFGVLCALLVGAGSGFALTPSAHHDLEFPLAYQTATLVGPRGPIENVAPASLAVGRGWTVERNAVTGTARMAYGGNLRVGSGAISSESMAADAALGVLDLASDLMGTRTSDARLRNVATAPGKWAVHFDQYVNGIRVHLGQSFVLLSDQGDVIAFGSDFFHDHGDAGQASLSRQQAIDAAAHSIGAVPLSDKPITADLLYVPAPGDELYELRIAYRVVFESETPFGRWESFVDGTTGAILARRNFFHTVNVIGTSQGDVEDFGYCDGVATKPFENQTVNVSGGNNDVTDDAGAFDITHGGATPVTVTAQFLGPWINVNRSAGLGTDASFSGPATPGTPLTINWTNANSRADERDTFFHGNRAHDFMKAIDGAFTGLDYAMPTAIGINSGVGFCPGNAWWDGTGMSYCRETATYGNTGQIGNVVYHEYGHGVTQEVYQANSAPEPPSDLHEGNSDILANLIDRQPIIGLGFFLNDCDSGIRNSDNNLQYPEDFGGGGHSAGQIIAGFVWDTWQSMLAALPQQDADDAIRNMWYLSRDLGTPQNQQQQVDWSFLADDDDANLDNGTPHYDHLVVGALNHGYTYPLFGVLIEHLNPVGSTEDGSAGFDVVATIRSTVTSIDLSSTFVNYRVNGGSFVSVPMTPTGNPDEFVGHIPAISGGNSEVEYYILGSDIAANSRTSPLDAPNSLYSFDVAYILATLESGSAGWTIGQPGDNATTGIWTLVNPIGDPSNSQPEDDATPAPGVNAFITGQCSGGACNPCQNGCNDVDGGTTTLLSPIYDMTGATQVKIKYSRWYRNDTGADPNNDFWVVDVSNDGGTSWTNIENTDVSAAAWTPAGADIDALFGTPGQVRLRFRAADLNSGSVVEAGVDDVRILADFGATGVEELTVVPATLSLEQNQPNPFSPMTRIDFAVPAKGDVTLAVYDVTGREVKTLSSGVREAGRYSVQWNGKDASGAKVAAGVYFYRLTSGGGVLTRKMTVLK